MANPDFKYAPMFQLGEDKTEYRLLSKEGVSVSEFEGTPILKVTEEALELLTTQAFHDVNFMLRREHNEEVAAILNDPSASDNDKYVALTMLRNAEVSCKGKLPFCQDTGTAIIHGEKGQQVWTGFEDEEPLAKGVYNTYTTDNLRYSQNAPLTMYDEVNTRCNLPAQIDIEAVQGMEYKFLCVVKGGGSANKTYLYQETKARIQNPGTLVPFLVSKIKTLGTAACPPYHIAIVVGGTSAEKNLLTVKLASTKYYDSLPTTGDETGRAFRDIELEKQLLEETRKIGFGAQFGGVAYAHDIRVIRLPRHGASCPIGLGVSCSADRNIKAKIDKDGVWLEKMDDKPYELIPEALRQAGESIMRDSLKLAAPTEAELRLVADVENLKQVVSGVRTVRNQKNISPREALRLQVVGTAVLSAYDSVVTKMANLSAIEVVSEKDSTASSFMVGTTEYAVPLGEMIDVAAEIEKAEAQLQHLEGFLASVRKKLSNEKFVAHAPEAVVAMERKKESDSLEKIAALKETIAALKG